MATGKELGILCPRYLVSVERGEVAVLMMMMCGKWLMVSFISHSGASVDVAKHL